MALRIAIVAKYLNKLEHTEIMEINKKVQEAYGQGDEMIDDGEKNVEDAPMPQQAASSSLNMVDYTTELATLRIQRNRIKAMYPNKSSEPAHPELEAIEKKMERVDELFWQRRKAQEAITPQQEAVAQQGWIYEDEKAAILLSLEDETEQIRQWRVLRDESQRNIYSKFRWIAAELYRASHRSTGMWHAQDVQLWDQLRNDPDSFWIHVEPDNKRYDVGPGALNSWFETGGRNVPEKMWLSISQENQ